MVALSDVEGRTFSAAVRLISKRLLLPKSTVKYALMKFRAAGLIECGNSAMMGLPLVRAARYAEMCEL